MKRVLKNLKRFHITMDGFPTFRSKSSKVFDMDDVEEKAEYRYWKENFGDKHFQEITDRVDMVEKYGGSKGKKVVSKE